MKRNQIRRIVIHGAENSNPACSGQVSTFHVQVIEHRLDKLPLTVEQKIAVIDKIIKTLKSSESDGIISAKKGCPR